MSAKPTESFLMNYSRANDNILNWSSGALRMVARGQAPLGIVYETDAKIEPAVRVIGVFPEDTHDPVIYPVALRGNAKSDAVRYFSFLQTQTAKSVFEKYGFNFLVKPTS